jgi:hypothetical protein
MKKLLALFSLLVFANIGIYAQDADVFTTKQYQEGFYRDFQEFKTNTPSVRDSFYLLLTADSTFQPIMKLPQGHSTGIIGQQPYWGLSIDNELFVNNQLVSSSYKGYNKLEKLAFPYAYFVAVVSAADEDDVVSGVADSFSKTKVGQKMKLTPYARVVALDMRTGSLLLMNDRNIRSLFASDQELMREYRKIMMKKDRIQDICRLLDRYNEKWKAANEKLIES